MTRLPLHTARPAAPPRVQRPSLQLSCVATWSAPWPSVTMVDARASRTASGGMRHASPVRRRVSPDCRQASNHPPCNASHPRLELPPDSDSGLERYTTSIPYRAGGGGSRTRPIQLTPPVNNYLPVRPRRVQLGGRLLLCLYE